MVQAHDFTPCHQPSHACFADASLKHRKEEARKHHDAQKPKDFDKRHAKKHGKKHGKHAQAARHGRPMHRYAMNPQRNGFQRPMKDQRGPRQPNVAQKVVNIYL